MRRVAEFLGLEQSLPDDIELPNLGKTSHHERFKAYAGTLSVVQNEADSHSVHCFDELVKTYQTDKECLLAEFVKSRPVEQRAERLDVALECANVLHGKNGHNANVIKCCEQFLETEQIRDLCGLALSDRNATVQQEKRILEAARYHGLSDFEIPVRVLVAKGPLSARDKQTYIDPRSENSAHVYREIFGESADPVVADLIEHTRPASNVPRSMTAQFLDLMDMTAALAAKPFFRSSNQPDAPKIVEALQNNAASSPSPIGSALLTAVCQGIQGGILNSVESDQRPSDLYVR